MSAPVKSLGEVAFEATGHPQPWAGQREFQKEAWEKVAAAVIHEHEARTRETVWLVKSHYGPCYMKTHNGGYPWVKGVDKQRHATAFVSAEKAKDFASRHGGGKVVRVTRRRKA